MNWLVLILGASAPLTSTILGFAFGALTWSAASAISKWKDRP